MTTGSTIQPNGLGNPISHTVAITPPAGEFAGRGEVSIPDDLLLSGDLARSGSDLLITAPSGEITLVPHFFAQEQFPDLVSMSGARMDGDWVEHLAGPQAPAQYAQADNTAVDAPIGTVESLSGSVTVVHTDGSQGLLQKGDSIFQGDMMETGSDGAVGVLLADDTTFSLGENGSIVMDELVYDPSIATGEATINIVKGVFTFVSGQIAKTGTEAMVLKTPVATIGIRGTSGGVEVEAPAPGGTQGPSGPGGPEAKMTVILTPDPDGSVGEMSVTNGGGTQVINQPFQGTSVASFNAAPQTPFTVDAASFNQSFGQALSVRPPSPAYQGQNQGQQGPEGEQQAEGEGDPQEGEGDPQEGDPEQQAEGEGEPQEGDGEPQEGEGESQEGDSEQQAEGEGEPKEGEQQAQGEGEPQEGEQQAEGSQEGSPEGEGQQEGGPQEGDPQEGGDAPQGEQVAEAGGEPGAEPNGEPQAGEGQQAAGEPQVLDQSIPEGGDQTGGGDQGSGDGPVLDQAIGANEPAGGTDPTGGGDLGGNDAIGGGNSFGNNGPISGGGGGGLDGNDPLTGGSGDGNLTGGGFGDILNGGGGSIGDIINGPSDGGIGDLANQQQNIQQGFQDIVDGQQENNPPPLPLGDLPPPPPEETSSTGNTITGTAGADTLNGTIGDDIFYGLAGADTFVSSQGTDTIADGDGTDFAFLSDGWNPVSLERIGNDMIVAYQNDTGTQAGSVRVLGQYGGTYGSDGVAALQMEDLFDSTPISTIGIVADANAYAASGVINSTTDAFDDYTEVIFAGTSGDDVVSAAGQTDNTKKVVFAGGIGDDTFTGGAGDDVFVGGVGSDSFTGGNHYTGNGDEVYYGGAISGINADLGTGSVVHGAGTDTLATIENLTGSRYSDIIVGDGNDNRLWGEGGNDTITGGAGDDWLEGYTGDDTLDGGDDNDTVDYEYAGSAVVVNLGTGTATGGHGDDTLLNIENVYGSTHDDTITGDGNANSLNGYKGDDTINGGVGDDTLSGGQGSDYMDGGTGTDQFRWDSTLGSGDFTAGDIDTVIFDVNEKLVFNDATVWNTELKVSGVTMWGNAQNLGTGGFNNTGGSETNIYFDAADQEVRIDIDGSGGYESANDVAIKVTGATNIAYDGTYNLTIA